MAAIDIRNDTDDATQVLAAAQALEPRIRAAVDAMETERCLPPSLVQSMKEAGIFRMAVARMYGGLELPPAAQVRVIEELSRLDGSVGWCAMIGGAAGYLVLQRDFIWCSCLRRHEGSEPMMSKKGQRQRRRLGENAPPSSQKPEGNLAPRDLEGIAEELVTYHAFFHDLFQRREQREWSAFYLRGQLADIERKTVEPMVLALKGPDRAAVRAGQQFLGEGAWEDAPILARSQRLVAQELGEPDGIVIFDGSGFPKQGTHSVGVARQYCGAVGKIANCQQGVFAAYVSRKGYTFLDRRLYLPEDWFDVAHAPLRQRSGVPATLGFQTEPQLALEMLRGLVERGVLPFQWVTADEHYGRIPAFLDGVAATGKWYFAEVPASTKVWEGEPPIEPAGRGPMGRLRKYGRVAAGAAQAQEVRQIAAQLSARAWRRATIKEGSKGPIEADFAFVRVTRARRGRPGLTGWLILRRSLDGIGMKLRR